LSVEAADVLQVTAGEAAVPLIGSTLAMVALGRPARPTARRILGGHAVV